MDLNTMSITELKALAYDILAQMEVGKANLMQVNQAIKEKSDGATGDTASKGGKVAGKNPHAGKKE